MHTKILVKVKADSSEEAIEYVREELEQTIKTGVFDYVGDMKVITEKDLVYINSFEDLEKEWGEKAREQEKRNILGELYDNIRLLLAPKHLSSKEALLFINSKNAYGVPDKELNNLIEKQLKEDTEGSLPKNYDELLDTIMNVFKHLIENDSYLINYLQDLVKLRDCTQYNDDKYLLLNTVDNHYADLTSHTTGSSVYYILADRHV